MRNRATVLLAALAAVIPSSARAQGACEGLSGLALSGAAITSAVTVPAGTFNAPAGGPGPATPLSLPAYCRVQGTARPTGDSEIRFEVWLPQAASWNGKFEQIGNGGFAGTIIPAALAGGVARGYATAATDDGHVGPSPSFAIGHPEKVVDFGHRAVHQTALQAKAILRAFYGKDPSQSYFFGCSDGGREALMEAQRYPEDFIGIIAGAPANNWTGLLTSAIWNWKSLNETPASAIPKTKLPAIQAAAIAACDQLDGVKDGLIEDPRRCRFQPKTLLCKGADGPECLTRAQVATLEKLYGGLKNPRTGALIFAPMVPGTEAIPGNWDAWIIGGSTGALPLQAWFGTGYFSNMVFEDPKWDYHTMDFERDMGLAMRKTSQSLDSNDPDLRPFRDRGGKLIQYHGWGDAAIAGGSSIDYYDQVKAKLGQAPGKSIEEFYRLFMVPGMGHCAGGIGPNDFGNLGVAGPTRRDPDRDVHAALERWVEKGVAPERLIAAGVRLGVPASDPSKVVAITRPLCPYPKTATYKGSGSTDDAGSFVCSEGKR